MHDTVAEDRRTEGSIDGNGISSMYSVHIVIDEMVSHSNVLTVRPFMIQPSRLGAAVLLLALALALAQPPTRVAQHNVIYCRLSDEPSSPVLHTSTPQVTFRLLRARFHSNKFFYSQRKEVVHATPIIVLGPVLLLLVVRLGQFTRQRRRRL